MFFKFSKVLLIVSMVCLLIGCDKQASYRALLKNPSKLQTRLNACQNNQLPENGEQCQQAIAVKQAITLFTLIEQQQSQRFPNAQQELMNYQALVQRAAKDKQLRTQIRSELAGVTQYYLAVSENFGKQIMHQEIKLSKLKQAYKKLSKTNTNNDAKLQTLQQQINRTEYLIEAMLALINVNTGGQS